MAYGDIGTVKTPVEVSAVNGGHGYPIRIGPGRFAVFYLDGTGGLQVKTYSVTAAGVITGISTSETVVDADGNVDLHAIHISGTIYALVSLSDGNDGAVTTVDIATDGTINDAAVARHVWQAGEVHKPFICHLTGNVYVIVCWNVTLGGGAISTISISDDGATISNLDAWMFYLGAVGFSCCIRLSDAYITIAHKPATGYAKMFSVEIAANGTITEVKIDEWTADPLIDTPWPIKVGSEQYLFHGKTLDEDGWCGSVSITDLGAITQSWDDQLEVDTTLGGHGQVLSCGGIYYAACYNGPSTFLSFVSWWTEANGNTKNTVIEKYYTTIENYSAAKWCWVRDNIYVCTFENDVNDVYVVAIDIESFGFETASPHEMMMGMGP